MHWALTKLKLNFYLINLNVTFTDENITHFRILMLEYDEAIAPFKSNVQGKKKKSISSIHLNPKTKRISPAGNRTPVSRVTGGDTHHYTTEELNTLELGLVL